MTDVMDWLVTGVLTLFGGVLLYPLSKKLGICWRKIKYNEVED